MFGALFLFTTLGTHIDLEAFRGGVRFLPLLIAGMFARLICVSLIALFFSLDGEPEKVQRSQFLK